MLQKIKSEVRRVILNLKSQKKPEYKKGRLMFQDDAGFGRINKPKHCWCKSGTRPCVPCHHQKKMCGMLCHIAEKRRTELSAFASLRHDMKNHLIVLERLISCGETERACRYISLLSGDTGLSGDICTGSTVLDALLCSKTSGLPAGVFDCHIRADIPAYISDRDICIIFGNMIDNAVNGCFVKGVPGEFYEGAFIDLRTVSQGEGVLIECRNYCIPGEFSEGTGLWNIRRAAARYGGTVTVCVWVCVYYKGHAVGVHIEARGKNRKDTVFLMGGSIKL